MILKSVREFGKSDLAESRDFEPLLLQKEELKTGGIIHAGDAISCAQWS